MHLWGINMHLSGINMHLYGINMHLYKLSLSRESAGWGALALSDDPKSARLVTRRRQRISFLAGGALKDPDLWSP